MWNSKMSDTICKKRNGEAQAEVSGVRQHLARSRYRARASTRNAGASHLLLRQLPVSTPIWLNDDV